MRHGDWSGQGFAWDGLPRVRLGTLILLGFPLLTATAHAQQASSTETCAPQFQEAQEEAQRRKESFQAERTASSGADLLTGLLVSGKMDTQGIRAKDISLRAQAGSPVKLVQVTTFRSVDRVAVRLEVQLPEGTPWRMEGAVLRHEGEEISLKSWPSTPLPQGRGTLVLEREVGASELKEHYSLEVREAGGNRNIVIKQIEFP